MKHTPMTCAICGKVAVLGQWFVMTALGPAHKWCAEKA